MVLRLVIAFILLGSAAVGGCVSTSTTRTPPVPALKNLHRLSDGLYSGAQPVGRAGYDALAALGIRSLISVDAIAPDQTLAGAYGIEAVHLPISYSEISHQRAVELAHAIATLPRPIYVHCHHGKHRGPAAICVGAIGAGELSNDQAIAFLHAAGTAQGYSGLWDAVGDARPLTDRILLDPTITLVAQSPIKGFTKTMGEIDRLNEQLWDLSDNGFAPIDDRPDDPSPAALAGQIHDLLRSLETDVLVEDNGIEFLELLLDTRDDASTLETQLDGGDLAGAALTMITLTESCVSCHERFRD